MPVNTLEVLAEEERMWRERKREPIFLERESCTRIPEMGTFVAHALRRTCAASTCEAVLSPTLGSPHPRKEAAIISHF